MKESRRRMPGAGKVFPGVKQNYSTATAPSPADNPAPAVARLPCHYGGNRYLFQGKQSPDSAGEAAAPYQRSFRLPVGTG